MYTIYGHENDILRYTLTLSQHIIYRFYFLIMLIPRSQSKNISEVSENHTRTGSKIHISTIDN